MPLLPYYIQDRIHQGKNEMPNEPHARIKINKLLEEAGWRLLDDENGQANVQLESGVTITHNDIDALGDDFEKTTHGFIDYLLLDESKFPIARPRGQAGG